MAIFLASACNAINDVVLSRFGKVYCLASDSWLDCGLDANVVDDFTREIECCCPMFRIDGELSLAESNL
jgi:hypothetical protein